MNEPFYLFKRGGVFYLQDRATGKQQSLRTRHRDEAERIWRAKNEAARTPLLSLAMARAYLSAHDPQMLSRTWEDVMNEFCTRGKPQTQACRRRVVRRKSFDLIRYMKLLETTPNDFLAVLKTGKVFVHSYLRCLHNLALGLGWLPWPVLPQKLWPAVETKPKRGITREEHERIIRAEQNVERRHYYELLWETGASQTDGVMLCAENIDWARGILAYQRCKTGEWACLRIGECLGNLLRRLPAQGPLFPHLSTSTDSARAAEFCRRCRILGIQGVSLHSYRYSWA